MPQKNVDSLGDRCNRICREASKDCYVNKREQMICIADMVISKTMSISSSLGAALESGDISLVKKKAAASLKSATELSNWIKYLQIVPDLRALSTLVLDARAKEKRTEIRYPMPESERGRARIIVNGRFEAELVDFSQSGFSMRTDKPIESGSEIECRLTSDATGPQVDNFKATIVYSRPAQDGHAYGSLVHEVRGASTINFFNIVNRLLTDIKLRDL